MAYAFRSEVDKVSLSSADAAEISAKWSGATVASRMISIEQISLVELMHSHELRIHPSRCVYVFSTYLH